MGGAVGRKARACCCGPLFSSVNKSALGEISWAGPREVAPIPTPKLHPQSSCCSRMKLDVLPDPGTIWVGTWEGTRNGPGRERGENPPSTTKLGGVTHQGSELKRARGEREGMSDSSRPHQCTRR